VDMEICHDPNAIRRTRRDQLPSGRRLQHPAATHRFAPARMRPRLRFRLPAAFRTAPPPSPAPPAPLPRTAVGTPQDGGGEIRTTCGAGEASRRRRPECRILLELPRNGARRKTPRRRRGSEPSPSSTAQGGITAAVALAARVEGGQIQRVNGIADVMDRMSWWRLLAKACSKAASVRVDRGATRRAPRSSSAGMPY